MVTFNLSELLDNFIQWVPVLATIVTIYLSLRRYGDDHGKEKRSDVREYIELWRKEAEQWQAKYEALASPIVQEIVRDLFERAEIEIKKHPPA